MFNSSDEIKLAFLGAWIDGDGFTDNKGVHISSCNFPLILQGRDLLLTLGIPSSIYRIDHTKCETSGRENSGLEYTLNLSWIDAEKLIAVSKKVNDTQRFITSQPRKKPGCLRATSDPTLFAYRIADIEIEEVTDVTVYNFEVEEDHSYLLGGVISHNSKQAYDECSWCGHKAKTDKDRCKCIPAHLGEINKQGQMCGMHNPNPRWFEISHVKRGADRIGLALGKLAEDSRIRPMLPTDYLNLYGDIYVPEELTISKKASDKRELLKKLAEIEKHVDAIAHGAVKDSKDKFIKQHAHKISKTTPVEAKDMDDLRKHSPGPALKSLADNGVIFSPEDFIKYLLGDRAPEGVTKGMKSHLPDAFSSLENKNDGSVVNNEKYEPEGKTSPDLKSLSGKLKENHSLEGGPAVRRIMMITISIGPKDELKGADETPKSKEAADKLLAEEYCAYKLAALNYLDEQGKLDDDLLLNAVLQNR